MYPKRIHFCFCIVFIISSLKIFLIYSMYALGITAMNQGITDICYGNIAKRYLSKNIKSINEKEVFKKFESFVKEVEKILQQN